MHKWKSLNDLAILVVQLIVETIVEHRSSGVINEETTIINAFWSFAAPAFPHGPSIAGDTEPWTRVAGIKNLKKKLKSDWWKKPDNISHSPRTQSSYTQIPTVRSGKDLWICSLPLSVVSYWSSQLKALTVNGACRPAYVGRMPAFNTRRHKGMSSNAAALNLLLLFRTVNFKTYLSHKCEFFMLNYCDQ